MVGRTGGARHMCVCGRVRAARNGRHRAAQSGTARHGTQHTENPTTVSKEALFEDPGPPGDHLGPLSRKERRRDLRRRGRGDNPEGGERGGERVIGARREKEMRKG